MHTIIATLVVALTSVAIFVPAAPAAPTEVNVRVEGKTETLFEGPVRSDGHNVRASGDSKAPAAGRPCNGLNNGANPVPGPTPTAAAADAMSIVGEGFDGDWYAAPFEDYFITQWGPDRQSVANAEYWGLIVNNVFASVGGCQLQLDAGDEVLWAYDAFGGRPRLVLYPGDYGGGPVRLTAEAQLGVPFEVEVDAWDSYNEGSPPASPQRSAEAFAGALVAPVTTGGEGFEAVDAGSAAARTTDANGRAELTFASPGWHRIKATQLIAGKEAVVRSNRLDVCVAATLGAGCGPLPADDLVRQAPPEEPEGPGPGGDPAGGGGSPGGAAPGAGEAQRGSGGDGAQPGRGDAGQPPAIIGPPRVTLRRLDRSRLGEGRLGVSWRVADAGAGIAGWRISSRTLGRAGAFVTRASGRARTAATVRLPRGASYRLRIVFTDALGRASVLALGKVRVPE